MDMNCLSVWRWELSGGWAWNSSICPEPELKGALPVPSWGSPSLGREVQVGRSASLNSARQNDSEENCDQLVLSARAADRRRAGTVAKYLPSTLRKA